jgi:hypothetical protein
MSIDRGAEESVQRFYEKTGAEVTFSRVPLSDAPYLMGFGFWEPFRVTFSRHGQEASVIALVRNRAHTLSTMLFTLSSELGDLEKAQSFEAWIAAVKAEKSNDRHFVHEEPYTGEDLEMQRLYASHEEYLEQRYAYLVGLDRTLRDFFGDDFPWFEDYWFKHVTGDWKES